MDLILTSLLITSFAYSAENSMALPALDVYDGDTIKTELLLPPPLNKTYIRIAGIDTPEKGSRAKCEKERLKAEEAAKVLKQLIPQGSTVIVSNFMWDKFGSRIRAEVTYNGINIGQEMIKRGLAVPYHGEGTKYDWCK